MRQELERRLKGKVVLVGVGNSLLGDDGAGPALIHLLQGRLPGRIPVFLVDGGEAPEAYWGKITAYRPHAVLVIDAVDWGGEPGSVALVEEVEQRGHPCSTHRIPLNLFLDLLRMGTGGDVFVLAIQPKRLGFNAGMSPEVLRTVEIVGDLVTEILAGGVRCS